MYVGGYGFGLFVRSDMELGHVVGHSGGYPGFGSHMRWHPASGIGVIALGNRTYFPDDDAGGRGARRAGARGAAPIRTSATAAIATRGRASRGRAPARGWDDDLAARLFAFNVDLDEPLDRRRAAIERIAERFGALTADADAGTESDAPVHLVWWMRGEHGGRVRVEIQMHPERPSRVQSLDLPRCPGASEALRTIADRVVGLLNEGASVWPDDLVPEARLGADRDAADRSLRAASALFAPVEVGDATHGDGETTATFPLEGDRGTVVLSITVDPSTSSIAELSLRPGPLVPPTGP